MKKYITYLKKQKLRNDPVGDFARDTLHVMKKLDLSETDAELVLIGIWGALKGPADDDDPEEESSEEVAAPHRPQVALRTRFLIFRRDSYRCQICGRSAQDGVILEVDHKMPVAENGNGDTDNLWTLCFECNRGKGALAL